MSEYFAEPKTSVGRVKAELDLSNHATTEDLKTTTGVETPKFVIKVYLANLKSNVDKLDIDQLKVVPTKSSNLKSELDVDKLASIPVDLSKLSDVVKIDAVKKDLYNGKVKEIEDYIPDTTKLAINTTLTPKINEFKKEIPGITNLVTTTALNVKINEVKYKIPNFTNVATTTALRTVTNKIPNVSNLVKKTEYNTKISEIENKITADHGHYKYVTTQELNKLTSENFTARLRHRF